MSRNARSKKGQFAKVTKSKAKCSVCQEEFNSREALTDHQTVHQEALSRALDATLPTFDCDIDNCSKTYESLKALLKHQSDTHSSSWTLNTDEGTEYIGN